MKKQLNFHFSKLQSWASQHLNITYREQNKIIADATQNMQSSGQEMVGKSLISVSHILMVLLIIPVYCFLLAYYRLMIKNFLIDVFDDRHEHQVKEVISESKLIVQSYMIGLLVELAIVTIINAIGFLFFGIKYAIFLGLLAAVLNMIPYIGMLIAAVLCMLITLSTSTNTNDVIWVGIILVVVQFIDNNIIMPNVVSSKLKINALMSILGVLIGGAIAGVSGMFLSIPALAIIKVVCDRVETLKPWGRILGDDVTVYENTFSKKLQQVSFGFKKVKHKV
jgi:predicted PurR-regulated permease PerM